MHRVTTVFTGVQGAPYYSNFYFSDSDATQACIDATEAFWDACKAGIVTDCLIHVLDEVAIVNEADGEITEFNTGVGSSFNGTSSDEMLPPATQALMRWRTNLISGGRRVAGRTFIPALGEGLNVDGTLIATAVTSTGAAGQDLIDDVNTHFGVFSRTHHAFAPAVVQSPWEQFAQLRSRRD